VSLMSSEPDRSCGLFCSDSHDPGGRLVQGLSAITGRAVPAIIAAITNAHRDQQDDAPHISATSLPIGRDSSAPPKSANEDSVLSPRAGG
jgi:hypothetical protein